MRVFVEGIGLAGPGLDGWAHSREVLGQRAPYVAAPTRMVASSLLPAAERRRTGEPVKLALAVGAEAFDHCSRDAAITTTVFTSSGGDGENVHFLCETLASEAQGVSPTRFHNSVHNAPAGYWSIAMASHAPSVSLCGCDGSFSMGLLEAALEVTAGAPAVALIAYDHPYPEPLHGVRPIGAPFGCALILSAQRSAQSIGCLEVAFAPGPAVVTSLTDPGLEALRAGIPAARCLPLLIALARGATEQLQLDYMDCGHLAVTVSPC